MLHSTIIVSMVFLFNICLGDIVTYNEVGAMEQVTDSSSNNGNLNTNEPTYQEAMLRRRLIPGDFTDSEKLIVLNKHNQYRNLTARGLTPNQPSATNMNQLQWDEGLAQVAKSYSSKCIWAHNANRKTDLIKYLNATSFDYTNQYVGENLFISTGSESIDTISRGIASWYNENAYYKYGTVSGTATCQTGQQCGHYTQLVWANTRYVGCSYTKCATVQGLSTFSNAILFVCDYYFAGNYVGQYPYASGTTCSKCPNDKQTCNNGLCSGCPSRSWDTYCCEYCSSTTCSNAINSGQCNPPSSCTNGISSPTTKPPTTTSTTTKPPTTASTTTTTKSPTNALPTTTKPPTNVPPTTTTTKSPTNAPPTTTATTTKSPTNAPPTTTTTKSPTNALPTTTTTTTKSPTNAPPTTTTTKSPTNAPPTTTTTTTKSPTNVPPTTTTTKSPTNALPTTTKLPTNAPPTTTKSPTNAPPTTTKSPTNAPPTTTKSPTNAVPTL